MPPFSTPIRPASCWRAIDGYEGPPITRWALQLSALLFVRPGELRKAEWVEVDAVKAVWRIPASKMKGRVEHQVRYRHKHWLSLRGLGARDRPTFLCNVPSHPVFFGSK